MKHIGHFGFSLRKLSLVLLSVFTTLGLLSGCRGGHTPEARADWVVKQISSELDLNKDQRSKLEDVKKAYLESRARQKPQRDAAMTEVKSMILSEKLDAAKAKDLMERRHKAMQQDFDPIFTKVSDFHASLTPEQKKKAVALIEKFQSRFEDR